MLPYEYCANRRIFINMLTYAERMWDVFLGSIKFVQYQIEL